MKAGTAWMMLVASGAADVAWAYATKRSQGFTQPGWAVASLVLLAVFILLLTRALQVLPLGVAYSVWTGIGAVGALLVGMVWLGEPLSWVRAGLAAVIILGVIGLRLTQP